eukprot:5819005-Pleurochrysis_carterae.AAC.3
MAFAPQSKKNTIATSRRATSARRGITEQMMSKPQTWPGAHRPRTQGACACVRQPRQNGPQSWLPFDDLRQDVQYTARLKLRIIVLVDSSVQQDAELAAVTRGSADREHEGALLLDQVVLRLGENGVPGQQNTALGKLSHPKAARIWRTTPSISPCGYACDVKLHESTG